ncbi:DMT family transporter [Actinophytocola sp.]|uniref:DMT family transporter n=1 Tax=Actinophytocola sp. TaxID=1872138 RepID=UPI003D6A28BA
MYVALLATTLLVGCLLAVQTSVNLQLSGAVKTPYGASTLQLAVAAVALAIVALAVGTIGVVSLVPDVTWWHLLGGLASPLYITSGILLFPRLGALAAVGLFVTGQVLASLGLDLFGLIGVPRKSLTIGIVLGVVAVLIGITLIIRQRKPAAAPATPADKPDSAKESAKESGEKSEEDADRSASTRGGKSLGAMAQPAAAATSVSGMAWIALGIIAGAVLPIQGAVNGKLKLDIDAPFTVGMISFIVATLSIAIVTAVLVATKRTPTPQVKPLATMPWWGWLGGLCAASYVVVTFLMIPEIGAATTIALTVTGQQLFSAVIDHFGLFRMPKRALTGRRVAGLALLLLGSVLVQLT